eukprot:scaffold1542_cov125-Amphora_coffeaeformis.AAC.3
MTSYYGRPSTCLGGMGLFSIEEDKPKPAKKWITDPITGKFRRVSSEEDVDEEGSEKTKSDTNDTQKEEQGLATASATKTMEPTKTTPTVTQTDHHDDTTTSDDNPVQEAMESAIHNAEQVLASSRRQNQQPDVSQPARDYEDEDEDDASVIQTTSSATKSGNKEEEVSKLKEQLAALQRRMDELKEAERAGKLPPTQAQQQPQTQTQPQPQPQPGPPKRKRKIIKKIIRRRKKPDANVGGDAGGDDGEQQITEPQDGSISVEVKTTPAVAATTASHAVAPTPLSPATNGSSVVSSSSISRTTTESSSSSPLRKSSVDTQTSGANQTINAADADTPGTKKDDKIATPSKVTPWGKYRGSEEEKPEINVTFSAAEEAAKARAARFTHNQSSWKTKAEVKNHSMTVPLASSGSRTATKPIDREGIITSFAVPTTTSKTTIALSKPSWQQNTAALSSSSSSLSSTGRAETVDAGFAMTKPMTPPHKQRNVDAFGLATRFSVERTVSSSSADTLPMSNKATEKSSTLSAPDSFHSQESAESSSNKKHWLDDSDDSSSNGSEISNRGASTDDSTNMATTEQDDHDAAWMQAKPAIQYAPEAPGMVEASENSSSSSEDEHLTQELNPVSPIPRRRPPITANKPTETAKSSRLVSKTTKISPKASGLVESSESSDSSSDEERSEIKPAPKFSRLGQRGAIATTQEKPIPKASAAVELSESSDSSHDDVRIHKMVNSTDPAKLKDRREACRRKIKTDLDTPDVPEAPKCLPPSSDHQPMSQDSTNDTESTKEDSLDESSLHRVVRNFRNRVLSPPKRTQSDGSTLSDGSSHITPIEADNKSAPKLSTTAATKEKKRHWLEDSDDSDDDSLTDADVEDSSKKASETIAGPKMKLEQTKPLHANTVPAKIPKDKESVSESESSESTDSDDSDAWDGDRTRVRGRSPSINKKSTNSATDLKNSQSSVASKEEPPPQKESRTSQVMVKEGEEKRKPLLNKQESADCDDEVNSLHAAAVALAAKSVPNHAKASPKFAKIPEKPVVKAPFTTVRNNSDSSESESDNDRLEKSVDSEFKRTAPETQLPPMPALKPVEKLPPKLGIRALEANIGHKSPSKAKVPPMPALKPVEKIPPKLGVKPLEANKGHSPSTKAELPPMPALKPVEKIPPLPGLKPLAAYKIHGTKESDESVDRATALKSNSAAEDASKRVSDDSESSDSDDSGEVDFLRTPAQAAALTGAPIETDATKKFAGKDKDDSDSSDSDDSGEVDFLRTPAQAAALTGASVKTDTKVESSGKNKNDSDSSDSDDSGEVDFLRTPAQAAALTGTPVERDSKEESLGKDSDDSDSDSSDSDSDSDEHSTNIHGTLTQIVALNGQSTAKQTSNANQKLDESSFVSPKTSAADCESSSSDSDGDPVDFHRTPGQADALIKTGANVERGTTSSATAKTDDSDSDLSDSDGNSVDFHRTPAHIAVSSTTSTESKAKVAPAETESSVPEKSSPSRLELLKQKRAEHQARVQNSLSSLSGRPETALDVTTDVETQSAKSHPSVSSAASIGSPTVQNVAAHQQHEAMEANLAMAVLAYLKFSRLDETAKSFTEEWQKEH